MEPHQRPSGTVAAAAPLYEARFEHDACGVGFVADAGGHSRDRVLPLALAGLAALGHRGAFGADGESSDGAGVALPLDRLDPAADRRGRTGRRASGGRLALPAAWPCAETACPGARRGPRSPRPASRSSPGARSRSTSPRSGPRRRRRGRRSCRRSWPGRSRGEDDPRPIADAAFERRLVIARRRLETAARAAGGAMAELSVPSASARTIVYKGLVIGSRLPDLYPDLREPLAVGYAVFHQRYATNTHPVWRLAQPFRSIAHNGEINTVRGNREQVRGRAADAAGSEIARALLAAGPLLSEDGSDSLSLDEALELLPSTGWELTPALLTAIPEALALRRAPHPHVATLRRRTAGFLAPWDGPAAIVFADGRHVGVLVDRNGLRPAAFAVTRDRLVAVASEAGAVPFTAAETVRRGRLGPGELLLVEPGRRSILEDAEAKTRALRALPDPRRGAPDPRRPDRVVGRARHDADARLDREARPPLPLGPRRRTRPARHQDDGARGPRAALEHGRRHADAGPRPPRPARRRPPPPGVRAGHEPGDRPGARAGRDGPAGRARSPSGAARRPAPRTRGRSGSSARSSSTSTACSPPCGRTARAVRTLDATWDAADGASGLEAALDRLAQRGRHRGPTRRGCPRRDRSRRVARSPPGPVDPCRPGRSTPHSPRPACAAGPTWRSVPPTSSTSMPWRWSSRSAPRPSSRVWRSSSPPSWPGRAAPRA